MCNLKGCESSDVPTVSVMEFGKNSAKENKICRHAARALGLKEGGVLPVGYQQRLLDYYAKRDQLAEGISKTTMDESSTTTYQSSVSPDTFEETEEEAKRYFEEKASRNKASKQENDTISLTKQEYARLLTGDKVARAVWQCIQDGLLIRPVPWAEYPLPEDRCGIELVAHLAGRQEILQELEALILRLSQQPKTK